MDNTKTLFREFAFSCADIELPFDIYADNKEHRFKLKTDKQGQLSGVYAFGSTGGYVGDSRTTKRLYWKPPKHFDGALKGQGTTLRTMESFNRDNRQREYTN
jgi:hypothetical protein